MLLTYPLMVAIQEISARIGRVTGHGIAGNVCRNFPAPVIWAVVLLLFVANTINIAADLGAMADSLRLLIGGPRVLYVVAFGVVSVLAQIFLEYSRYVAILKWLTLTLFAYVITLAAVKVPWGEAVRGLVLPSLQWDGTFLTTLVAILGTTISPYLFIWQSSQEAEEQRIDPDKSHSRSIRRPKTEEYSRIRIDTIIGMAILEHYRHLYHYRHGRHASRQRQNQYRNIRASCRSIATPCGSVCRADFRPWNNRDRPSRNTGARRVDRICDWRGPQMAGRAFSKTKASSAVLLRACDLGSRWHWFKFYCDGSHQSALLECRG